MVGSVILQLSPLSGSSTRRDAFGVQLRICVKLLLSQKDSSTSQTDRVSIVACVSHADIRNLHHQHSWSSEDRHDEGKPSVGERKMWEESMRPCAMSHMNEQQHMTYPQLQWILFFWVARCYFQPRQTAPWLIHDGGRGWIKYSYRTHKHIPHAFSWI